MFFDHEETYQGECRTNVCKSAKVCFLLRALTANKDVHDSYVKLLLLNLEMIELHF